MLMTAAAVLHGGPSATVSGLEDAYLAIGQALGGHAGVLFGVALLASGLSSTSVGTMAGQVVMQGFIRRRIPLFLRRLLTILPALVVLGSGIDPTNALVLSQVVLSFGIPFALIPLVWFSRDRSLMGELVNRRITTAVASAVAAVIVALNGFLLYRLIVGVA
jgi:manganese transport protein